MLHSIKCYACENTKISLAFCKNSNYLNINPTCKYFQVGLFKSVQRKMPTGVCRLYI